MTIEEKMAATGGDREKMSEIEVYPIAFGVICDDKVIAERIVSVLRKFKDEIYKDGKQGVYAVVVRSCDAPLGSLVINETELLLAKVMWGKKVLVDPEQIDALDAKAKAAKIALTGEKVETIFPADEKK